MAYDLRTGFKYATPSIYNSQRIIENWRTLCFMANISLHFKDLELHSSSSQSITQKCKC